GHTGSYISVTLPRQTRKFAWNKCEKSHKNPCSWECSRPMCLFLRPDSAGFAQGRPRSVDMTSNHEASRSSMASDDEIAAMVTGKDGLRMLLQPQVDLLTGRIVSAEALARWQHSRLGIIMPGEFIPAVNRLGLDKILFERVSLRVIDMLLTL